MAETAATDLTAVLDEIAPRAHYDNEMATDCAVCRLVAAVRAVLALADELAAPLRPAGTWGEGYDDARTDTAVRLRSALTAALTEDARA